MFNTFEEKLPFISSSMSFAYSRYELHKYQSVIQLQRIEEAFNRRNQVQDFSELRVKNKNIIAEIHLYFVALTNLNNMLKVIIKECDSTEIKRTSSNLLKLLEPFTNGRNIFEHFDGRLPGKKNYLKAKEVTADGAGPRRILEGLRGKTFLYGDKEWDISSKYFELNILTQLAVFEQLLHQFVDNVTMPSLP